MKKKFERKFETEAKNEVDIIHDNSVDDVEKLTNRPAYSLVVKSPFGKYKKGDMVRDQDEVNQIIGTHQESLVLKIIQA